MGSHENKSMLGCVEMKLFKCTYPIDMLYWFVIFVTSLSNVHVLMVHNPWAEIIK
jgi:hypothetical protein